MARTRITRRTDIGNKKPPPVMPTLDTPESPAAASTAITESSSFTPPTQQDDNSVENSEPDEEDLSVTEVKNKKPHAKRHVSSDNDDDDNMFDAEEEFDEDAPVKPAKSHPEDSMSDAEQDLDDEKPVIIDDDEKEKELSDDEEVLFLGVKNPRPETHSLKGNSHRNVTMSYCVGNVFFGKATGHFMIISNGFDGSGSPRVNFRCHLLNLWMENGKCTTRFFLSITLYELS
jgi:hypothetical protein